MALNYIQVSEFLYTQESSPHHKIRLVSTCLNPIFGAHLLPELLICKQLLHLSGIRHAQHAGGAQPVGAQRHQRHLQRREAGGLPRGDLGARQNDATGGEESATTWWARLEREGRRMTDEYNICIYIYVYIYIHICIYIYIYIHICTYIYIYYIVSHILYHIYHIICNVSHIIYHIYIYMLYHISYIC